MLSEEAIEKLVQPMIDRQEKISRYVVDLIAKRVNEIGHLLPSDIHKLQRLLQMGGDVRLINEEIARQTNLNIVDIKKLIKEVALDGYIGAKAFYDYRHLPFIPFEENEALRNVVRSVEEYTLGTYRNLSNSSAFMIRDLAHSRRLRPTTISETYQTVVDEAIQSVQSGVIDFNTAMRRSMKQLNDSGIRYVTYNTESGRLYTQRLDSALRRCILDGVTAVQQGIQDEIGKQIHADGKEISVHAISAPDHEPVQGHQFTNEEYEKLQSSVAFQDYTGEKFAPIERHIGQYNCRHFTWSIILGIDKPNFTKEELEKFKEANAKGYTLPNGKHMSLYDCTQKMREMETAIRRAKEGQMMAQTAGDIPLAQEYQAKATQLSKDYRSFCKACGIQADTGRASVPGYKKMSFK